ncbi:MAG: peroxiredoxin-like family protein [Planctomycetota bacterium]
MSHPLDNTPDRAPSWTRKWLIAAGIYNLVWGAAVVLFPNLLFEATGIESPVYPQIWQCVGMIVGVYGIGYLVAARDSRRHWPIVLVGFLGKIFGPIGFAQGVFTGELPWQFGLTIPTNDLIWWIPFGLMLWDAARAHGMHTDRDVPTLDEALDSVTSTDGRTLRAVTDEKKTLVVLLRHSGCTFCKEALEDLRGQRDAIERAGVGIAVVTMSDHDQNNALREKYGLSGASFFSDPDRVAYRALELRRGSFLQLFGLASWTRGVVATLKGHAPGPLVGDGFQMPGSFVVHEGRVLRAHRHAHAAERLDHASFACESPA